MHVYICPLRAAKIARIGAAGDDEALCEEGELYTEKT